MPEEKWQFSSLGELHQAANEALRQAMIHERSKKWSKVIESYKRLLWMINTRHFPRDYDPPESYNLLLYELHYHLGVALQHLGDAKHACHEFTEAIEAVSIPKGTCGAECIQASCLMTPMYCRRAFAYCQIGKLTEALRDAERAVVLDSVNSDVFCVRALVRGSRDEQPMALKDTDLALKNNANHICAIMIRDALIRPLKTTQWMTMFELRAKTESGNMESFHTITSFDHPKIMDFFDRFLFSLNVPHTITDINLTPTKPSRKQIETVDYYKSSASSSGRATTSLQPFRCGTAYNIHDRIATRRRLDYGEAIRRHSIRPKTSTDYFLSLVGKDRSSGAQGRTLSSGSGSTSTSTFRDSGLSSQDNLSVRSYDVRTQSVRDTPKSSDSVMRPIRSREDKPRTGRDGSARHSETRTRSSRAFRSPRVPGVRIQAARGSDVIILAAPDVRSPRTVSKSSSSQSQTARNGPGRGSNSQLRTAHSSSDRISDTLTSPHKDTLSPRNLDVPDSQVQESPSKVSSTWVKPVDHSLSTCSSFWSHPDSESQTRVSIAQTRTCPERSSVGGVIPTHSSSSSVGLAGTAPPSTMTKRSKSNHAEMSNIAESGRRTRTFTTKTFTIEAPKTYTIPVFVTSSRKNAPRMYYKPWIGDKLPVAEVTRPKPKPAFY